MTETRLYVQVRLGNTDTEGDWEDVYDFGGDLSMARKFMANGLAPDIRIVRKTITTEVVE